MKLRVIVLAASFGLLAAGCGSSEDSDQIPVTSAALDGSAFTATQAQGFELAEGVPLTITFDRRTVSVDAGCNRISGGYEIEDGVFLAKLISTLIGCPPPLDEIERQTTGLLSDGARARLEGETLTLTGEDGTQLTLER